MQPEDRWQCRAQILRLGAGAAPSLPLRVDGEEIPARPGESVLAAVLASRGSLRAHEFDGGLRAGFCLMGACHECWMWLEDGSRVQTCMTQVAGGMRLLTCAPPDWPGSA